MAFAGKHKSLSKSILIRLLIVVWGSGLLLGGLWEYTLYDNYTAKQTELRERFLNTQKTILEDEVENAIEFIRQIRFNALDRLKTSLRNQVDNVHVVALTLHDSLQKYLPAETIRKYIIKALNASRYNEGTGYYFIIDKDGRILLNPPRPDVEGSIQLGLRDDEGRFVVHDLLAIATQRQSGFYEYTWPKPGETKPESKLSYVREFAPYKWAIGTGEYLNDMEITIQEDALRMLRTRSFSDNGYIFVGDFDGNVLQGPLDGQNIYNLVDESGTHIAQEIISIARSGGGFINYTIPDQSGEAPRQRLSYVRDFRDWQWYIGAGIYTDSLDKITSSLRAEFIRDVQQSTTIIFTLLLLVNLAAYAISHRMATTLGRNLSAFTHFFKTAEAQHTHVNTASLTYKEFHQIADAANRMLDARLRAIKDLKDSEKRFELLIEQSPFAIEVYDTEGVLIRANRTWARIWGIENPAVASGTFNLLADKAAQEIGMSEALRRALAGETVFIPSHEFNPERFGRKGRPRHLLSRAYPLRGEDNTVEFAAIMHEDITDRREAELDRDKIFETSIDLLSVLDGDGKFLRVNPAWTKTLGWTEKELLGRSHIEFVHPDDAKATTATIAKLRLGQNIIGMENRYRHKDGTTRWMLSNAHIDVETMRIYTVARDFTERKYAEREMLKLRTLLASIVDSMPSILVGIDDQLVITRWNKSATNATGLTADNAVGKPLAEALPLSEDEIAEVRLALETQQPRELLRQERYYNGHRVFEDLMVYPLKAQEIAGAVLRLDDVTNRSRMEAMIVQSQKMLSVGGLAAGMAHEINNPLGGILQGVQNILRRLSPELPANNKIAAAHGCKLEDLRAYLEDRKILRMLEGIRDSGERAANIVSSMLNFSRQSESHKAPTDLSTLLAKTISLAETDYDFKAAVKKAYIDIVSEFEPNIPEVPCTHTEIQQVVLSMIRNAAQAIAAQPKRNDNAKITLRLHATDTHAVIEIEDTGPGLPPEDEQRIFEPFYTTHEPGKGTGLGLSVSYFIITQNHGGEVEVESTPGKGTRFIISLPFTETSRRTDRW